MLTYGPVSATSDAIMVKLPIPRSLQVLVHTGPMHSSYMLCWYGTMAAAATTSFCGGASGAPSGATAAASRPLPAGWESGVDPASGVTYYCNPARGVTQWEFPAA